MMDEAIRNLRISITLIGISLILLCTALVLHVLDKEDEPASTTSCAKLYYEEGAAAEVECYEKANEELRKDE